MKLATLKEGGRDGTLVVVSRDLRRMLRVPEIATTLQRALDDWATTRPRLVDTYERLNANEVRGSEFDPGAAASPLPRAYQWADGSAYLSHVERVRRARCAEIRRVSAAIHSFTRAGRTAFSGRRIRFSRRARSGGSTSKPRSRW
jgi:fumarylacetoacetate (FAA) hydrolase